MMMKQEAINVASGGVALLYVDPNSIRRLTTEQSEPGGLGRSEAEALAHNVP
jgi:hypothetical protein